MEFTRLYPQASPSYSKQSPDGRFVLTSAPDDRLVLRYSSTLAIHRTWKITTANSNEKAGTLRLTRSTSNALKSKNPNTQSANTRPASQSLKPSNHPSHPQSQITQISFSPDSTHLVASSTKSNMVWIYSVDSDEEVGRIKVGLEGLGGVKWSKAGSEVLCWSLYGLRLTIWSLVTGKAKYIQNPKHSFDRGNGFRHDARYFALIERHKGKDTMGIYDCMDWSLVRHFPLQTVDSYNLSWSPNGKRIAVWESSLEYTLYIFTPTGKLLSTFSPYSAISPLPSTSTALSASTSQNPNHHRTLTSSTNLPSTTNRGPAAAAKGSDLAGGSNPNLGSWCGLGIRTVEWHPSGRWLAIGGWDGIVRVLNDLVWTCVCEISTPTKVTEKDEVTVFKEPKDWIERTRGKGFLSFDRLSISYTPVQVKPDPTKPNPKMGVSHMEFSQDGDWLALRKDNFPNHLFVYSLYSLRSSSSTSSPDLSPSSDRALIRPKLRSIVLLDSSVNDFKWSPATDVHDSHSTSTRKNSLAIAYGLKSFGLLTIVGDGDDELADDGGIVMEGVGIPAKPEFATTSLSWSPDGSNILLSDREAFCLVFPVDDEDMVEEGLSRMRDGDDDDTERVGL